MSQPSPPDLGCNRSFDTATANQAMYFPPRSFLLVSAIKPRTTEIFYRQSPFHIRAKFMVSALFPPTGLGKKLRAGFLLLV